MALVNFVTPLHVASKRDYLARMTAEKPECMRVAKKYGKDYWDGNRKYGYGGYKYDGRWKHAAKAIAKYYKLAVDDWIMDIGCGKGFLLYEFHKLGFKETIGVDTSNYAIKAAEKHFIESSEEFYMTAGWEVNSATYVPLWSNQIDFIYSINVLHNLCYTELKQAIKEMVRLGKQKMYICVESYRNEDELYNLQCWALTCQSFYSPDDWKEILADNGYKGDVEFIYFP